MTISPPRISADLIVLGVAIVMVVALIGWSIHSRRALENAKTETKVERTENELGEKLRDLLEEHTKTERARGRELDQAITDVREAGRPQRGEDELGRDGDDARARRSYDAWVRGVGRLCPDCLPDAGNPDERRTQ